MADQTKRGAGKSAQNISHASRRRFIGGTVFAVTGASAAMTLPAVDSAADSKHARPPGCPAVKTPLKDVEGKVAVITGASSGIGLGIARAFAAAGMQIVLGYRTPNRLDDAMKHFDGTKGRVHPLQFDVTDRPGLEKAAVEAEKIFGKVHVLVNNAGVVLPPTLSATSFEDWDWELNVNLNGPFNGIKAFLPLIQSHGEGGQVITTSSALGLFAIAGGGAYTVSKYAVVGMMEALRVELADTNIGVSVFCPGLVNSNIEENSFRQRPPDSAVKDDPQLIERMRKARDNPELAMDPLEAGNMVLRGMRNNDLYILTSPEYERIMRDRSEALLAALPRDVALSATRAETARSGFKNTIYSVERDRKRCGQKLK